MGAWVGTLAGGSKEGDVSAGCALSFIGHRSSDLVISVRCRESLPDEGFATSNTAKHKDGHLSRIISIEQDGTVVLASIGIDGTAGEPRTVTYNEFAGNYTPTASNVEVMSEWQAKRPSTHHAHADYVAKALVTLGLQELAKSSVGEDLLRVHVKPSRSVSVSGPVGKGKLLTVPQTMKMQVARPTEVPEGSVTVKLPSEFGDKVVVLLPHFAADFAVPAWAVKSTDVQDEANVEFVFKVVTIDVGVQGKGKGRDRSGFELRLPVMTNTKALAANTELLVYRAAAKKNTFKRGFASLNLTEGAPSHKRKGT